MIRTPAFGFLAVGVMVACSGGTTGPPTAGTGAVTATSSVASPATAPTISAAPPIPPQAIAPCGRDGSAPPRYEHVVWIWMENHTADAVLGDPFTAPFEHELAAKCGSGTAYRAVGSPSLPNYLAATSGSTHGVRDDDGPASHPLDADNVFQQVRNAGGTARSYEEAMVDNCQLQSRGRYAVKHNPQPYYTGASDRAACQRDNVPLGQLDGGPLADDLASGHLPTFAFITPDLCNDTHDCGVATGDRWLDGWLGAILTSRTYQTGTTAVFVVWDEPTPMPILVVSPTTPNGVVSSTAFDHYSLLRTTDELLGLSPYLGNAATAESMRSAFGL